MSDLDNIKTALIPIGEVISKNQLKVPQFQRSYAWKSKHINDLINDINTSIERGDGEYFLGSVVFSEPTGDDTRRDVIDGQQRLATISILIAAIRDNLHETLNDRETASELEKEFLFKTDRRTRDISAHLMLNNDDHEYFRAEILSSPQSKQGDEPQREAQKRLQEAYVISKKYVEDITRHVNNKRGKLLDIMDFLESKAKVIQVNVPNHSNAFTIFETLNDRGKDLTLADLLKNYLFGASGMRLDEAISGWSRMTSVLESVEGEAATMRFLRHYWASRHESVRERDLYESFKNSITTPVGSVSLCQDLHRLAELYAKILNPEHQYWGQGRPPSIRKSLKIIHLLRMKQIRPLLLSAVEKMNDNELDLSLKLMISWGVRFMIVGGIGGGTLEKKYSDLAVSVSNGQMSAASELASAIAATVPNDSAFTEAFKTATVSKHYLARYYLKELEMTKRRSSEPEFVPNENTREINLEHVLPQNLSQHWSISDEEHRALRHRIGNMALMRNRANSTIGNDGFLQKKPLYTQSEMLLTKELASFDEWTKSEIDTRQEQLAQLAVVTWPIRVS